tara:strand:- start:502 stop:1503 length:1002 start_codon:yes stop_codon:yes gene_type:complete
MVQRLKKNWTKWHHTFHKEILNNENLIPNGYQLLVSVSGGQDSMALLTLLNEIKEQHNWSINVWHGDHKWHSKSEDFANKLKNYCFQNNIIFYLNSASQVNTSTEAKSREWRYEKLYERALEIFKKYKTEQKVIILTAHTSTDNAETFFLNLSRGSDFAGLGGIHKKRLINDKFLLVRPFLIFTRSETASICQDLKIPYWEDPTNADTNLKRNFIRHNVINELEKIFPGCSNKINVFMDKLRNHQRERSELCELAAESFVCEEGIKRSPLNTLTKQTRATILHYLLIKKCNTQISTKNIRCITEEIFKNNNGRKNLPNGIIIVWNKNFINFTN